jgi:Cd2+/Zn2+-exporting ATPase
MKNEKTLSCIFGIGDLDCANCARKIEKAVSKLPGVKSVSVSAIDKTLRAQGGGPEFDRQRIAAEVSALGYKPLIGKDNNALEGDSIARFMDAVIFYLPIPLIIAAAAMQFSGASAVLYIPFYLAAVLIGGYGFARKGLLATLKLSLDMNALMTIAVIGAMALGDWLESSTVVFLFALAERLEARSVDRARRAVEKLMDIAPHTAIVQRDGTEIELPVGEVGIGEKIIIKPGARVPLDGTITGGASYVNQAQVTGESMPVSVERGNKIFAGSMNGEGALEVKVTCTEKNSTIARIVRLVREAQTRRAPTERFVDRFARVYTPAAVGMALLVALLPPVFLGDWGTWFYRALVLLVIACPCALVISTPVGIVSGLTAAARAGVLIKGGMHLEQAASVNMVAFDKTGTLTTGEPAVIAVHPSEGKDEDEVVRLAASLERYSEHPLAEAIVAESRRRGLEPVTPAEVRAVPGKGVEGRINEAIIKVGSHRFLHESGLCPQSENFTAEDCPSTKNHSGRTEVSVARDNKIIGTIWLSDSIREEASEAIAGLRALGSISSAMLTGDNRSTAAGVASKLGIEESSAELIPEGKVERLKKWREDGYRVMMVGDGVNDAPALAAADVGVAMGAAGTDIALETADIALMADDLRKVPFTIAHSRRTMRVITQNIVLSILIKALFLALAVAGWATLWMAILADMGVSLAVIGNSLRLLSNRKLIYMSST